MLDVDGQVGGGVLKIREFSWTSYVYRPLLLSWVTFWRRVLRLVTWVIKDLSLDQSEFGISCT